MNARNSLQLIGVTASSTVHDISCTILVLNLSVVLCKAYMQSAHELPGNPPPPIWFDGSHRMELLMPSRAVGYKSGIPNFLKMMRVAISSRRHAAPEEVVSQHDVTL